MRQRSRNMGVNAPTSTYATLKRATTQKWVGHIPILFVAILTCSACGDQQTTPTPHTDENKLALTTPLKFERTLASGFELTGPLHGMEHVMLQVIEGDSILPADQWIFADQISFAEGSSEIDAVRSKDQLMNIAAILKAFPQVTVHVGGYVDTTGATAERLAISQQRAQVILNSLVEMGVSAARANAKGYGSAHIDKGQPASQTIAVQLMTK